jgi:hypothetical protein
MIVITIIAILAATSFRWSGDHSAQGNRVKQPARTAHDDRSIHRRQERPQTFQDLVEGATIETLSIQSIHAKPGSGVDSTISSPDQTESGISDLHSGSTAISSEGTPTTPGS